jgi:FkbM family methyltransferase
MSIYAGLKKAYYVVLDAITFGTGIPVVINDFKLKLPTKYHRHFQKDYEESSFKFFKKYAKQGGVTLDIGAHIGLYSVFFSKLTNGKVYSFEPTPSTAVVLRNTIGINKCSKNVTVVEAAVSEKPGVATFYSNDVDVSDSNSLVDFKLENFKREGAYEVAVVSVDDFRLQHGLKISILKIDAEGVELEVLKGAKETFLQDRPIGILGLHPFAYKNKTEMLGLIWNMLLEYKMKILMDGVDITKEQFCNIQKFVFDIEFLPQ